MVTWSLRLQKLYNTLLERAPPDEKPNPHMVRSIYFYGLTNEKVQDNNHHHFDSGLSFDELLKETRNTEFEFQQKSLPVLGANPKKAGTVHQVQMDKENDAKLTKVLDMVTSLGHRMDKMRVSWEKWKMPSRPILDLVQNLVNLEKHVPVVDVLAIVFRDVMLPKTLMGIL